MAGIEVDGEKAAATYNDMEEKKGDMESARQTVSEATSNIKHHWKSEEKAPPFHHAMDEIEQKFTGHMNSFMENIEKSREDLKKLAGF